MAGVLFVEMLLDLLAQVRVRFAPGLDKCRGNFARKFANVLAMLMVLTTRSELCVRSGTRLVLLSECLRGQIGLAAFFAYRFMPL